MASTIMKINKMNLKSINKNQTIGRTLSMSSIKTGIKIKQNKKHKKMHKRVIIKHKEHKLKCGKLK